MVLDQRRTSILHLITRSPKTVEVRELTEALGVSQRTIYYDISQINGWLEREGLSPIKKEYGKGFYIPPDAKKQLPAKLHLQNEWEYRFSGKERQHLLILFMLSRKKPASLKELIHLTQVSRGTLFRDLKKTSTALKHQDLELAHAKNEGYSISGNETKKRKLLTQCISDVLSNPESAQLREKAQAVINPGSKKEEELVPYLEYEITLLEKEIHVSFTEHVVQFLVYQLLISLKRQSASMTEEIDQEEKDILKQTESYLAVERLSDRIQKNGCAPLEDIEKFQLTMQILGSRVHYASTQHSRKIEEKKLKRVITKIVDDFQLIGCLLLEEREQLENNLLTHLKPAYYRLKYDLPINEGYAEKIESEYPDVFYLTKRSLSHLESFIGKSIPEEEVAYIAMHFGGWLKRGNHRSIKHFRAFVVCENGIAASGMLRSQLEALLPEVFIAGTLSVREYNRHAHEADIIFSTSFIKQKTIPVIYVPALLNDKERERIVIQLNQTLHKEKGGEEAHLLSLIEEHATIHDYQTLQKKIYAFLQNNHSTKETHKPMLEELLTPKTIQLADRAESWQEAVKQASIPLLKDESIKESYVDAMIENIYENGAYVVIAPQIAIPHARPETGVERLGMSLLRLRSPVFFSEDPKHQASLVIVLAAVDNETHLKALSQLTEMLSEPGNIDQLLSAETKEDVLSLVSKYSYK